MKGLTWKLLLPLLLAGGIASGAPGKGGAPRAMPKAAVGVTQVVETDDMETRHYTGQVVAKASVQIVPRVSGEIQKLGFEDGSVVEAGQMLYTLDPIQYEAAAKGAEAKVAECKAKLAYAQSNYDRNSTLFEKKAVSRDTFESTRSTLESGKAELLAAEADLIAARDNLKNTVIHAPIRGIVGVTNFTVGNYITPTSGTLLTIVQTQPIRVRFSISMADLMTMFTSLNDIRLNGSIRLKLANGMEYPTVGTIELVNNEANRKTDTVQLFAIFPNDDAKLLPGCTVTVTLARKKGKRSPAVPPSAVMHDSRGAYVYVVTPEKRAEKRYVALGNSTESLQLISSGVRVGESVIHQGTHKVIPDGEIIPVN